MAYWYLSSWSTLVLAIIISYLVFYFISLRVCLTFVKAVVIILKHATLLRLSNLPPKLALTRAELEYQEANIDLKIHEHLMVSSQVQDIEQFADFIMATDIGWSLLESLTIISHQTFSLISFFAWIKCASRWCCLNSFDYNLDPVLLFLPPSSYGHLFVLVSLFPFWLTFNCVQYMWHPSSVLSCSMAFSLLLLYAYLLSLPWSQVS